MKQSVMRQNDTIESCVASISEDTKKELYAFSEAASAYLNALKVERVNFLKLNYILNLFSLWVDDLKLTAILSGGKKLVSKGMNIVSIIDDGTHYTASASNYTFAELYRIKGDVSRYRKYRNLCIIEYNDVTDPSIKTNLEKIMGSYLPKKKSSTP